MRARRSDPSRARLTTKADRRVGHEGLSCDGERAGGGRTSAMRSARRTLAWRSISSNVSRSPSAAGAGRYLRRTDNGLYSVFEVTMRALRVAEDIVPVSDFKARATDWLKRVAESGQPVVITQNGKAAGVLLSPGEFDRLTEQARFVASVGQGLADADAGRVHTHASVVAEMKRRFRKRPRK